MYLELRQDRVNIRQGGRLRSFMLARWADSHPRPREPGRPVLHFVSSSRRPRHRIAESARRLNESSEFLRLGLLSFKLATGATGARRCREPCRIAGRRRRKDLGFEWAGIEKHAAGPANHAALGEFSVQLQSGDSSPAEERMTGCEVGRQS